MKKNTVLSCLALLSLFALAPRADGALSCAFQSVTGVAFGSYDVFGASPKPGTGTIVYQCRKVGGVQFMTMSLSTGSSGNFTNRTLRRSGSSDVLYYNLYPDATYSQVWGDVAGTYQYTVDPIDQKVYTLTVYGRISPAGQDVGVGSYTDTITVTMNF